jgi:hypothetical protein
MMNYAIGGGAAGGGVGVGMAMQQLLNRRNGKALGEQVATALSKLDSLDGRMDRFEQRLDNALDRGQS